VNRRRPSLLRRVGAIVALSLCATATLAGAVIIDSGDGGGNLDPPAGFPYWKNVDQRFGGTSVIYLGRGWVLTARHVGAGIVVFDSQRYSPDPATLTLFGDPNRPADLLLFRLSSHEPWPELPMLDIATRPPRAGEPVLMIGNGRNRDERRRVHSPTGQPLTGWAWGTTTSKRWGTNRVIGSVQTVVHNGTSTRAFSTRFDSLYDGGATEHEAQAAEGDSGGAVFARRRANDAHSEWVLAGVMFTVNHPFGGSASAAYYGDLTHAVDLSAYRREILAKVRPECVVATGDGLAERLDAPADCGWAEGAEPRAVTAWVGDALDPDVRVLRDGALLDGGAWLRDEMLLRDAALLRNGTEQREPAVRGKDGVDARRDGSAERWMPRAAWVVAGLVVAAGLATLIITLGSRTRR